MKTHPVHRQTAPASIRRNNQGLCCMVVACFAITFSSTSRSAPQLTALNFPNYSYTTATGVSNDGTAVVGTASNSDGSKYVGFEASFTGTNWIAQSITPLSGDGVSNSTAISPDGLGMVGNGSSFALLYDGNPAITKKLSPISGDNESSAFGVCAGGSFVVGSTSLIGIGGGTTQAALWSAGGNILATGSSPMGLGFLPYSGFNSSVAYGVTVSPLKVVGYSSKFSGYNNLDDRAFLWQEDAVQAFGHLTGKMKDLSYPAGYTSSLAVAISNDGSTVVGACGNGNILAGGFAGVLGGTSGRINGDSRACYWKPDLPDRLIYFLGRPSSDNYSIATAISANGSYIVGSSGTYNNVYSSSAIIWTIADGKNYTLLSLLQNAGIPMTGWSNLREATGVSSDGNIIVGYGTYNGAQTGFRIIGVLQALNGAGGSNKLPTVSLTTSQTSTSAPANVTILATAADADGTVAKVELFQGNTSFGVKTAAPFTWTFSNQGAGTYVNWKAVATDNLGASTTSALIGYTIYPAGFFVAGSGTQVGKDILFAGNTYDQVLMTGTSCTVGADAGQITRVSFIDLNDDIVFAEFGGAGALTITLDSASGPVPATKYNQPGVNYMKGRASYRIDGASSSTYFSTFSLGTDLTRIDGRFLLPGVALDGIADVGLLTITGTTNFGGVNAANAIFSGTSGRIGVYAPGTTFAKYLYVGDVSASGTAIPTLDVAATPSIQVVGGDLSQPNGASIRYTGFFIYGFTSGVTSTSVTMPAQPFRGSFVFDPSPTTP